MRGQPCSLRRKSIAKALLRSSSLTGRTLNCQDFSSKLYESICLRALHFLFDTVSVSLSKKHILLHACLGIVRLCICILTAESKKSLEHVQYLARSCYCQNYSAIHCVPRTYTIAPLHLRPNDRLKRRSKDMDITIGHTTSHWYS